MPPHSDISIFGLNYPPEQTGIAPYTGALAAGLKERGHEVGADVGHPHYPEWVIREGYGQWARTEYLDGVRVRRRLHYVPRSPRGFRRLLSELSFGARIVSARSRRARVAIAVSPSLFSTAMVASRLRLTPRRPRLIIWVQDIYTLGLMETGEGGGFVGRITRHVEAGTLRSADRVVVIHQRFADFVTEVLGVDRSRVAIIRNWTHLPPSDPVNKDSAKAALGWPIGVILVVHTGNMGVKQGLENVIEAARLADERCAQVHFVLVGDGGQRRSLEQAARGLSRLTFVDPLGDDEYRLALGAADVLLVNEAPGVSAMAVPSKLTSYFDAGRPVIAATDPDGITASEVGAAGAGIVVPAGNPCALLEAVLDMAGNPEAMGRFSASGRRYREDVLDEQAAIDQWARVIESVVAADE